MKCMMSNSLTDSESQLMVVELMQKYALRPRDAYHLLTIQHHKIDFVVTFDSDFEKVFSERVLRKVEI